MKPERAVEFRKLEDLTPDPNNARTHSHEQIEQIAGSIRRFGFTSPALVDEVIRAGNGRHAACALIYAAGETIHLFPGKDRGGQALPAATMPVLDCSGWSEDERRAYALADNQIALNAGWDEAQLVAEIEALQLADFDIPLLGFDVKEIYKLFADAKAKAKDPNDIPDITGHAVSKRGDLWVLGKTIGWCAATPRTRRTSIRS